MNSTDTISTNISEPDSWLFCTEPLTDRLKARYDDVRLDVLSQKWLPTDSWMKTRLNIQSDDVWQRNIVMNAGILKCWFARTIIPKDCYDIEPAFFDRLHRETMRELLFDEPKVVRISLDVYQIDPSMPEYQWVESFTDGQILWLRLASFRFKGIGLFYLFEIFLPDMW